MHISKDIANKSYKTKTLVSILKNRKIPLLRSKCWKTHTFQIKLHNRSTDNAFRYQLKAFLIIIYTTIQNCKILSSQFSQLDFFHHFNTISIL